MPHCPNDGTPVTRQSAAQITETILGWPNETRIEILAPMVRGRKGEFRELFEDVRKRGFVRVRVDGKTYDLGDVPTLNRRQNHDIAVVVDRLTVRITDRGRLNDSVETALKTSDGLVEAVRYDGAEPRSVVFSERFACPVCGLSLPELEPRQFSFNSPFGACPDCHGVGTRREVNAELILGDPSISILEGVILPWGEPSGYLRKVVLPTLAKTFKFELNAPWSEHSESARQALLHGAPGKFKFQTDGARGRGEYESEWEGVLRNVERRYRESSSDAVRVGLEEFMIEQPCQTCGGKRLKAESLAVLVSRAEHRRRGGAAGGAGGGVLRERARCARTAARDSIPRSPGRSSRKWADRLRFLRDVGLEYLTLGRGATSLSGGETQRIRLATQIGSRLVGVLYILDEPSVGLHQRDNERLLGTLRGLRDLGNTVIVVEHDADTIQSADHVIDLGPAGRPVRRRSRGRGHGGRYPPASHLADRPLPPIGAPRPGAAGTAAGAAWPPASDHRREGEQPAQPDGGRPAGALRGRDRRLRLGEEHAGERHPLPVARAALLSGQGDPRRAHPDRGPRPDRQGHRHRPEPDRPDAALEPRDLHRSLHADPRAVHPASRTPSCAGTGRDGSRST